LIRQYRVRKSRCRTNIGEAMAEQTTLFGKTLVEEIQDKLIEDIKEYEFVKQNTVLKTPGNKWRVASALQKAIRRGQVEMALKTAHAIHGFEPDYVWRRLCTVVMEEVGVADIDLCARYLWVATNKTWRNKNGGSLQFLYMLVEQMCRSLKDRNSCDLPVIGQIDPAMEEHRKAAKDLTADQLAEVVADNDVPIENRALAAQALGCWDHPNFTKTHGGHVYLEALKAAGIPDKVIEVAKMGRQKQYEWMPYGIPFVWQLAEKAKQENSLTWEPDELTQLPLVAGLPSEAFDRHNQEGNRSLAYFFKACEPVRETYIELLGPDKAKCLNALGAVLFRVEGHQVDRRLVYPGSKEIDRTARIGDLWYNGVIPEHQQKLMEVTAAHLDDLHKARVRVVSPTP